MTIKKAYEYLFYKLYKFSEAGPSVWMSDWKAELAIDIIEGFFLFALCLYYNVYINRYFKLPSTTIIIVVQIIIIGLPNYFFFHHRNQWKAIESKFEGLPKKKNIIGGWIVFAIVLFSILSLVFAFYQMSLIDWKQYN